MSTGRQDHQSKQNNRSSAATASTHRLYLGSSVFLTAIMVRILRIGTLLAVTVAACLQIQVQGWVASPKTTASTRPTSPSLNAVSSLGMVGSKHGENACFLPIKQLDQDYYAPRIVQIAGAYPGLTKEEFYSVQSEDPAVPGQWTYDFSGAEGAQFGTVAIEGSNDVAACDDPIVIIAEHDSVGIPMPDIIKDPVDLLLVVDRSQNRYSERKFLVLSVPGEEGVSIGAFPTKDLLPQGSEILGRVILCQIPWLPSMKPTKSGFLEVDEYY